MRRIPETVLAYAEGARKLHLLPDHPIGIVTSLIGNILDDMEMFDSFHPVVDVRDNFDELLIPKDHPSRSESDTFYLSENEVLRTHTSAHQVPLMREGHDAFLVAGDVYRRDDIDRFHHPIFHQVEGVRLCEDAEADLLSSVMRVVDGLFPDLDKRIVPSEFPFTTPSFEVEVLWDGGWVETLGCGVIHPGVISNSWLPDGTKGWAFGMGVERLAMLLFRIPDIRFFWVDDERFSSQFSSGKVVRFEQYSKYPPCYKDISFWVGDGFSRRDMEDVIRENGGDLIEEVVAVSENPEKN